MIVHLLGSFIFWMLACFFYAVISVQKFRYDQSILTKWPEFFHPLLSYMRKYKMYDKRRSAPFSESSILVTAPKNWYYRFFKIKYKERFPLSATLLAFTTDAFHMGQMLMNVALIGAVTTFSIDINTLSFVQWALIVLTYKLSWSGFHEFCFVWLLIKKEYRNKS